VNRSQIRTSRTFPNRPPKPSLDAQRVYAILLELGLSHAEALERIRGDATLSSQLGKNGMPR